MDYEALSRKYFDAEAEKRQTEEEKIVNSLSFLIENFQVLKMECIEAGENYQRVELVALMNELKTLHPVHDKARVRELMFQLTTMSISPESPLSHLLSTLHAITNNLYETQAVLEQMKKYEKNFHSQFEKILELTREKNTCIELSLDGKGEGQADMFDKIAELDASLESVREDQSHTIEMQETFQKRAKVIVKSTKLLTEQILLAVQKKNKNVEQEQPLMTSMEVEDTEDNFFDELEAMGTLMEEDISAEEREFMQDLLPDDEEIVALSSHHKNEMEEYRTSELVVKVQNTMLEYFGEGATSTTLKKAFFDPKIRADLIKYTYNTLVKLDPAFLQSINELRKRLQIDALSPEDIKEKNTLENILKSQGYDLLSPQDKEILAARVLTQKEAQYLRALLKKASQFGFEQLTVSEQVSLQLLQKKKKLSQTKVVKKIKEKIRDLGVRSLTFAQKKQYAYLAQLRSEEETNITLFKMHMVATAYQLTPQQTNLLLTLKSDPAFLLQNTFIESIVKVISLLDKQYGDVDPKDLLNILDLKKVIIASSLKYHPTYEVLVKLYEYLNQDIDALISFLEMVDSQDLPLSPKSFWFVFMMNLEEHMRDNGGYYPDLFEYMRKFIETYEQNTYVYSSYEDLLEKNRYADFE